MSVKKYFKLALMAVLIGLGVFTSSVVNAHGAEVEKWTKVIEANPNDYMAYYNRGLAFIKEGRAAYSMSLPDFSKAIELKPDFVKAYYERGNIYLALSRDRGMEDFAIADFKKIIEIDPNYVDAYTRLGVTYMGLKQYDLALGATCSMLKRRCA